MTEKEMHTHASHAGAIKKLVLATLALSLAACGGGSSGDVASVAPSTGGGSSTSSTPSSPSSSSSSSSTPSSTPISTAVSFNAFSNVGSTSAVPLTFTTSSGVTSVTGANLSSTTTITTFDAKGNATAITGGFTKVLAFGGDVVGQVCDNVAGHAYYSFVLAGATPVPVSELAGKSFTSYENCAPVGDKTTFNADGSVTTVQGGTTETAPPSAAAAAFSSSGLTADGTVTTATAYKTTVNGTVFYTVIMNNRTIGKESTTGWSDILIAQ
jgi:hypothetical protein